MANINQSHSISLLNELVTDSIKKQFANKHFSIKEKKNTRAV